MGACDEASSVSSGKKLMVQILVAVAHIQMRCERLGFVKDGLLFVRDDVFIHQLNQEIFVFFRNPSFLGMRQSGFLF